MFCSKEPDVKILSQVGVTKNENLSRLMATHRRKNSVERVAIRGKPAVSGLLLSVPLWKWEEVTVVVSWGGLQWVHKKEYISFLATHITCWWW